ncbi:GtrA-like protein [Mariniphaga anaerophila]|uniref:GtrA-like protein n=1 Tax=Mariniphaga anaerophila TaxID=1484053 RepID=A0A1M4WAH5_9BACT|nr:GtrA family protein [Mariniphaga anaerophila]SHE78268.1 GtrA-like protein [Mariniphaga anaerophila]
MRSILHFCRIAIIRVVDFFYFPFLRFIPLEVFRYGVTGGANTVFDIFLYFIFYQYVLDKQILDLEVIAISPHIAAFLLVFPITFTTGFFLAKYVTFTASELRGRIQLFRYGLTVLGAILLNYIFLKIFVEYAGLYATLAKALTTVIVVTYSYISQRYFSFKTARISRAAQS